MTGANDIPVVIVGAGPVGLTAARLVANAGHHCVVVERREGPQRNPAAHVVNARTLEIFRHAGFDMQKILGIAQSPNDAGHVNFVSRLNGTLIGRLPFERQGHEVHAVTPHPLRNISQHRLEPLLVAELQKSDLVDICYNVEWVSAVETNDGVESVLRDCRTGQERVVHSSWLLGADGAGSAVRKWLGIEMIGPAGLQSFVAIHFRGSLRKYVADRPGALHFVMDPEVNGTFIAHDIDSESVFMTGFDPVVETIDDYNIERCAAIVRSAIGDPDADITITDVGTWHMTAQVAERFRRGRTFLVGDAAHRFPPTGGMGLNTGIADAHNLVWKLMSVEDGSADTSLLDTYQSERRPVAETNCNQSLTNAFKMILLAEALGLHPGASSADLDSSLVDPEKQEAIAEAVQAQSTHFDMLGLQLGYVYETVLNKGRPAPICESDPTPFVPSGEVGARLPHAWLADGRSTLDLVDAGMVTLFSFGKHDEWASAMRGSTHLTHVRVGKDAEVSDEWREIFGIKVDGAIVVRPDQHIAWVSTELSNDFNDQLATILDVVLGG